MKKLAALLTLLLLTTQFASADTQVALNPQMSRPSLSAGKVIGVEQRLLDTYGINLAMTDGVRLRDVFEVQRAGRTIARGIVVFAGPTYSLISLSGKSLSLQPGDTVAYAGRSEVSRRVTFTPSKETVWVKERDVMSSRSPGSANSFSMPSFSMPSFSNAGFSMPSFSNAGFSAPSFSAPSFSSASYSSPGFSSPSYSSPSF